MKELSIFGKLLVLKNIITKETLAKVTELFQSEENERTFSEILIMDFGVERDKIYTEMAKLFAIRKVNINPQSMSKEDIDSTKELIEALPENVREEAFEKRIIPYKISKKRNNSLMILASNPSATLAKSIASYYQTNRYEIFYCPFDQIDELLKISNKEENEHLKNYAESESEIDINAIQDSKKEDDEDLINQEINKGALVYLFEAALVEGVKNGISDIHIVPFDNTTIDIRFRVDGKLQLWKRKENINPQAFIAVVKDRSSNIDRFKIDESQDGFIQRDIDGTTIRFRVSMMPIVSKQHDKHVDSIVIRILDDRNVIRNIDKLGFLDQARIDFEKATTKPQGLVIVTGPTGSGKSTTLIASLYHIITPEKNVLTVEDPVEYVIEGARQLKISHKLDFAQAIRGILRHDPDIVLVGEIRDKETAEVAIKLANTGHLTLSTLHTNDAPSAVSRLYKMNIETFLLAYAINIIVAQRLIRRLCPKCKQPASPEKYDFLISQGIEEELLKENKIFEPVGCEHCRKSGFKGRLGIHEVLYFHKEIRQEIVNSKEDINEERIRAIGKKHGMLTLRDSGMELVRRGLTSVEEVLFTTASDA